MSRINALFPSPTRNPTSSASRQPTQQPVSGWNRILPNRRIVDRPTRFSGLFQPSGQPLTKPCRSASQPRGCFIAWSVSVEQPRLGRRPAGRQPAGCCAGLVLVEVGENLLDHCAISDAGDDPRRPDHRCPAFRRRFLLPRFGGHIGIMRSTPGAKMFRISIRMSFLRTRDDRQQPKQT